MDDWRFAADAHGVVSVADAYAAGLVHADVTRLTRAGELTRLARGWYALGPVRSPEDRHILAVRAALRAHGGRAVAGHHSALLVLGLPTLAADLSTVRLSRRTPGPTRTKSGLSLGRAVPEQAQAGDTVVPALAVVQHGLSAGPLSALVAADAALRAGLADTEDLVRALGWVERHPFSGALTQMLGHADGRHESPGETRLAHALRLMGISATPQVRITATGFNAIVDFLADDASVVIEFDGRVKYGRGADESDPYGRRRPGQQVLWDEKRREDRLRELGYEVVRVVWSDLDDPRALAARIRQAVDRARARSA